MNEAQRIRIEALVEWLIALLDLAAGDPDLEPGDNGIADLDALLMIEHPERYLPPGAFAANLFFPNRKDETKWHGNHSSGRG